METVSWDGPWLHFEFLHDVPLKSKWRTICPCQNHGKPWHGPHHPHIPLGSVRSRSVFCKPGPHMIDGVQASKMGKMNHIYCFFFALEWLLIQRIWWLVHGVIYVVIEWHEQGVVCSELSVVKRMKPKSQKFIYILRTTYGIMEITQFTKYNLLSQPCSHWLTNHINCGEQQLYEILTRVCTWDTWEEGTIWRANWVPIQSCSDPCCSWSRCRSRRSQMQEWKEFHSRRTQSMGSRTVVHMPRAQQMDGWQLQKRTIFDLNMP